MVCFVVILTFVDFKHFVAVVVVIISRRRLVKSILIRILAGLKNRNLHVVKKKKTLRKISILCRITTHDFFVVLCFN